MYIISIFTINYIYLFIRLLLHLSKKNDKKFEENPLGRNRASDCGYKLAKMLENMRNLQA